MPALIRGYVLSFNPECGTTLGFIVKRERYSDRTSQNFAVYISEYATELYDWRHDWRLCRIRGLSPYKRAKQNDHDAGTKRF